jgi:hypothetical protein
MKSYLFWQRVFSVLVLAGMLFGFVQPAGAQASGLTAAAQPKADIQVEQELYAEFQAKGTAGYLIYFAEKPDLSPAAKLDWNERGYFVMNALQDAAKRSQAGVQSYLNSQKVEYQSFWIDNVIAVNSSDIKAFNGLFAFSEIAEIKARRVMGVIEPDIAPAPETLLAIEPNILRVNADDVWAMGFKGQKVSLFRTSIPV